MFIQEFVEGRKTQMVIESPFPKNSLARASKTSLSMIMQSHARLSVN